jgi:ketosteroid isomerase-like protein
MCTRRQEARYYQNADIFRKDFTGQRSMKSLILTLALFTMYSAASADLVDDVRCREIGFSRSVEKQDAALFASFIDSDARFVGNEVLHGPDAIAAAWSVFFSADGPAIKWRPRFVEVLEDGRLALTRGPYQMITRDEQGVESEHWGTFNSVWRLQADGQWKVVFDAGSDPTETPTDEIRALLDAQDDCED